MIEHAVERIGQVRYALDNFVAAYRMLLDMIELLFGQLSRLLEDVVPTPNLTDVVK